MRRARGLTLVEVLVALALFALLAAATAGLQASALRFGRQAAATRAVTAALAVHALPARARDPAWDPCAGGGVDLRACTWERSACCGAAAAVEAVRVAWTPEVGAPVTLRLLARRAP